jgi:uncharacterized protein YpmB
MEAVMKMDKRFILVFIGLFFAIILAGCAGFREVTKGFAGVSTQVLDENRKSAVKKSFALDYPGCYTKVKEILSQKDKESYIYAENAKEKLIAVYLSPEDTTPVGIFFTGEEDGKTLIEVSSPSIYAKEEIAGRIFAGLDELINPKPQKSQENKINVKEE